MTFHVIAQVLSLSMILAAIVLIVLGMRNIKKAEKTMKEIEKIRKE